MNVAMIKKTPYYPHVCGLKAHPTDKKLKSQSKKTLQA